MFWCTFQIGHFTLDNVSSNKTLIEALQLKLSKDRDISFDAKDHHIMCFAYVVNLSLGRIIQKVDPKATKATNKDDGDGDNDNDNDNDGAIPPNSISLAHSVVKAIRASGMCQDAFNDIIMNAMPKAGFSERRRRACKSHIYNFYVMYKPDGTLCTTCSRDFVWCAQ